MRGKTIHLLGALVLLGLIAAAVLSRGGRGSARTVEPAEIERTDRTFQGASARVAPGPTSEIGENGSKEPGDVLRKLLRQGARIDRVSALQRMAADDRSTGSGEYERDVIAAIDDRDVIVAAAAAELVLGYYGSELFPRNRAFPFPEELGIRALEQYLEHGDYTANASTGPEPDWCSVPLLGLTLALASRSEAGALLATCERAALELERRDKPAQALAVSRVLAERGRQVRRAFVHACLLVGDPGLAADAAEIVRMSRDVAALPALRAAYEQQPEGASAKEAIVRAAGSFEPAASKETLIGFLAAEGEPSRRAQIVETLRLSGLSDAALADALLVRIQIQGGRPSLAEASALAFLGDHRIVPLLRKELEWGASAAETADVRRLKEIVRMIGSLKDAESYRGLAMLYETQEENGLRAAILDAARAIGTPEAISWAKSVSAR